MNSDCSKMPKITFGKLCVWTFGRLDFVPEYEQDSSSS